MRTLQIVFVVLVAALLLAVPAVASPAELHPCPVANSAACQLAKQRLDKARQLLAKRLSEQPGGPMIEWDGGLSAQHSHPLIWVDPHFSLGLLAEQLVAEGGLRLSR